MQELQEQEARVRKTRPGKMVFERIREMAISYEFLPGESINEATLAQQLGVSRSPVRDALNRLTTEGLITFRPNYGFFARTLTETELTDLAETRLCLELEALQRAFARGTIEERRELLAFWKRVHEGLPAANPRDTARADEEFHKRLFLMARNQVLIGMIDSINARIRFIREIEIETPVRPGADFSAHFRIADALIEGREQDGIAALRHHLTFTPDHSSAILREGLVRVYKTRN